MAGVQGQSVASKLADITLSGLPLRVLWREGERNATQQERVSRLLLHFCEAWYGEKVMAYRCRPESTFLRTLPVASPRAVLRGAKRGGERLARFAKGLGVDGLS